MHFNIDKYYNYYYYILIGPSGNQTPPEAVEMLHLWVSQLVVTESHYTRSKNPNRRFDDPHMNNQLLFLAYVEWMNDNFPDVPKCNASKFRNIFTKQYNITPRYV